MKKYRVSIACLVDKNGRFLRDHLNLILGDYIDFEVVNCNNEIDSILGSNLVLASGNGSAKLISGYLMDNTDIMIIRRTISRKNFNSLNEISNHSKVLVVNDVEETTNETISLLCELGFKHERFTAFYPGCSFDGSTDVAVTPDEIKIVPEGINKIINIGARVIDSSTIFDMLKKLGLLNKSTIKIIAEHMNKTIPLSIGLIDVINYMTDNKLNFEMTLNAVNCGVILYSNENEIIFYNAEIQNMFKVNSYKLIGQRLGDVKELIGDINGFTDNGKWIHSYNGESFLVTRTSFMEGFEQKLGGTLTVIDYNKMNRILLTLSNRINAKGHIAKHTFKDIVGSSVSIKKTIENAQNFSQFESPVLIQGESGTGKELFAQSIHNASKRKKHPFVAFNCASLSDSLLESELFGYDEGAFTGAKKYGKPGLFELANGGSLFLDEIGDISLRFQAKLLRVLQEQEFIRVGGIDIIPVDVRIISATNKNLNDLVRKGRFRDDLFYRISVLPLHIEPLRYRKEDISDLINYFYNIKGINKDISNSAMEILVNYDWPGNSRELENCVEYLMSVNKSKILVEDLPKNILENSRKNSNESISSKTNNSDIEIAILKILRDAYLNGKKLGRKTLPEELSRHSIFITESEVRKIINSLVDEGLVSSSRGRGGTIICEKGIIKLQEIEEK